MHSFPSMYDMYRQHISNVGENYVWNQKNWAEILKKKKSLFRLLLWANTFYGCLFKTSNQIENWTIDFLFKMHLVCSLEVLKNQKCFEEVTHFSENVVFFSHFILMFFSYFRTKLIKKNHDSMLQEDWWRYTSLNHDGSVPLPSSSSWQ